MAHDIVLLAEHPCRYVRNKKTAVVARRPYLDCHDMYAGIWLQCTARHEQCVYHTTLTNGDCCVQHHICTQVKVHQLSPCMERVFNPEMLVPRELTRTCIQTNKRFLSILLSAISLITLMKILLRMTLYRCNTSIVT